MKRAHAALFVLTSLVGIALGLGAYTFAYAKGWSYMTNDPRACANCHVMNEQYDGWLKGSHRSVAVCNDCHVPHGFVAKYCTKARNGFWHSYYFTTGGFPEPIQASARSREIAESACRHCHEPVVAGHGHSRPRRVPRDLLHPLPRLRGPPGAVRNQRRREVSHG